jgi:iron complex outermembrane receptor protein
MSTQTQRQSHGRWVSRLALEAAILATAAVACPATAQDAAGESATEADQAAATASTNSQEIVVTAQFRNQNLQDVPIAITAVTGEQLEQKGATTLADLGGSAPNVVLRQAPATYGPSVVAYIRGVGQRDTNFALEPGVGLYIDDVYLPTLHGSMLNLIDLDRVEILRGPQGTLAGQNSIGGAIKLYSKKPDDSNSGYVDVTYGSYNEVQIKGAANFSLVPGHLYARISGAALNKDGYITRYDYACTHPGTTIPTSATGNGCKLGTEGGKKYVAGRLAVRWEPTPDITVDVAGDVTRDDSEPGPTTLLYVGRPAAPGTVLTGPTTTGPSAAAYKLNGNSYGNATGSPFISYSPYGNYAQDTFSHSPYTNYEDYTDHAPRDGSPVYQAPLKATINSWGVGGTIAARLSDNLNLTSITAYRHFDGIYSSGEGSPFSNTLQTNWVSHHQFSEELRLNAKFGDLLNATLGGYYLDKNSFNPTRIVLTTLNFLGDNSAPSKTKAGFLNVELTPIDNLTLIGGVRYTDIKKSYTFGRDGIPGSATGGKVPPSLAGIDGTVGTYAGKRWDYRGVIQYRFTDHLMVYGEYSTGFKAGGINPRPFFVQQELPFGPETLTAWEGGLKSQFFDNKARLNLSGFINNYRDMLITVANCPLSGAPAAPCALPLNAGNARVKGFEAELNLNPVEGFSIDASLAYLNFKYTSISAAAANSGIGLEDRGIYISPWQWNVGAQYRIDLAGAGSLTPRIDVSHEDSFERNPDNVDAATGNKDIFGVVAGRTLVNARLGYQTADDDWEVALEVRNLTDKLYYTDVFDNRGSTNSIQGSPGEPRTWAVSVRRKF